MPIQTAVLRSNPGIKRDGTKFEGDFYTDGQWVRWQRGLPRKMGGFKTTQKSLQEVSRGFSTFTQMMFVYCHSGGTSSLERFTLDGTGNSSIVTDRTPATLTVDDHNYWMFDVIYDSSTNQNYLVAHVSPNGDCICNDQGGQIFYGEVLGTAVLNPITLPANTNVTGGIVSLHPYLFYYGTDGNIGWSVAGDPTDLSGTGSGVARVWGQKIIKGLPMRAGSGTAPAGLFWAFDAVIRATFVGGTTIFQFDVIATGTSIMSQFCVVDYDGVFYWAGVDRFYMFNGVVREVPNSMNLNYFFDEINVDAQTKTFGFQIPKYGEIWWCYPKGTATECTHAVVYNVRENTWYDTELPNEGRSAGHFNNSFAAPVLTGIKADLLPVDPTVTLAVTVSNPGSGNKYFIDGVQQPTLTLTEGNTYRFDQSDSTNGTPSSHPLRLSATSDGTHGGGTEYTTGVTVVGTPGSAGAYTEIVVPTGAPTLYYYCSVHSGMGGQANTPARGEGYKVWQHEFKVDEYDGPNIRPIKSYFETSDLSTLVTGENRYLRITTIEPDFVQNKDMTVTVTGRANARAPEVVSTQFTFPDSATEPYEQIVMLKEQRRELRVRFESNSVYGDYQMGQIIGHFDSGDGTDLG